MRQCLLALLIAGCGTSASPAAPPTAAPANRAPPSTAAPEQPLPTTYPDPATGFDLYVTPPEGTTWRLDGELHTERLPSRIRGLTPGMHSVEIVPPAGYLGRTLTFELGPGESRKVQIVLQPAP